MQRLHGSHDGWASLGGQEHGFIGRQSAEGHQGLAPPLPAALAARLAAMSRQYTKLK